MSISRLRISAFFKDILHFSTSSIALSFICEGIFVYFSRFDMLFSVLPSNFVRTCFYLLGESTGSSMLNFFFSVLPALLLICKDFVFFKVYNFIMFSVVLCLIYTSWFFIDWVMSKYEQSWSLSGLNTAVVSLIYFMIVWSIKGIRFSFSSF